MSGPGVSGACSNTRRVPEKRRGSMHLRSPFGASYASDAMKGTAKLANDLRASFGDEISTRVLVQDK